MKIIGTPKPLTEGEIPQRRYMDKEGNMHYEDVVPDPDYVDPEIREEDKFLVWDKEEFYDYVTHCKHCGTEFIAYASVPGNKLFDLVRNYCPGCGKRLVSS